MLVEASQLADECLHLCSDDIQRGSALYRKALICEHLGQTKEADEMFVRALELKSSQPQARAIIHIYRATGHLLRDEPRAALEAVALADSSLKEFLRDRRHAMPHNELELAWLKWEAVRRISPSTTTQLRECRSYFDHVLEQSRKISFVDCEVKSLLSLAATEHALGEIGRVSALLKEAMEIAQDHDMAIEVVNVALVHAELSPLSNQRHECMKRCQMIKGLLERPPLNGSYAPGERRLVAIAQKVCA